MFRSGPVTAGNRRAAVAVFGTLLFAVALNGQVDGNSAAYSGAEPQQGEAAEPSAAPLNPRFLEYVEAHRRGVLFPRVTAGGHGLGLIPDPVDFSHLKSQPLAVPPPTLPSSYDLRTTGQVGEVRDQGSCGDCWAFATYGSMESELEPTQTRVFSENNLKNLSGFDWTPCQGGSFSMSTAYLARWAGPINESDDPYNTSDTNTSPPGLPPQMHIQDVIILAGRNNSLDNTTLKNAVMTYGAIATSMYVDESDYYNASAAAYYFNGASSTSFNHSVTLVGWDDNFSSSNFETAPPGDGAFLIQNSWGTTFGQSGYFWISYYDTVYATTSASFAFVPPAPVTNFTRQYSYDPLGQIGTLGYSSTTAWFANVFTAVGQENLKAVSFYVASNSSPYVVYVYTGVTGDPTTGTLAQAFSGTASTAGYHTFSLPSTVAVASGTRFSVVVELTTPGYDYPIPTHYAIAGYSSTATASPGNSYYSSDGTSWTDATAGDSTRSVCVKAFTVTQTAQTITFGTLSNKTLGSAPFTVSASASSGLPVSFASETSSICTVSVSTVTLVAVGTCTIQATQAGNTTYGAATPVSQSFQVTQATQTITFGALANRVFGTAPFTVSATASSGLPVSFASTTLTVCTVAGNTVTLVAVGACTIQATQAGNANYSAATAVNQSFQVTQATQTIAFGALANRVFGTAPFTVSVTASSGLPVSFASTTLTACTVAGNTVTLVAVGTCTIQATQAGNANYSAATAVNQSFQVTQATQTITFGALANRVFGTAPFTVSATASSGLPVSFASTTLTVCTVAGNTVTLVAVGACTIQATQAGNSNYAAATAVNQSFQVTQASQTITFGVLTNRTFGTASFAVSATTSSGLPVSFASLTSAVCTVSVATVTLVSAGTCTIQAMQAGNIDYTAATPVDQSFQVVTLAITSLSPVSAAPSGAAFTLTVNGTAFVSGATVHWNGATLSTNFVSATQLTASVPAALIASAGMATITVANPGAVTSGGVGFPIQSGPEATAVSPGAGNGASQTFTFTFSDPAGYQNLGVLDVLINNYLDGIQACYVALVPSGANAGTVYLVDDGGDAGGPFAGNLTLPGTGSVSNSQCTVSGTGSSVVGSGTTITLTLNISFSASFAGNRVFYTAARDTGTGNSGWQALSTWTVPGATATPTQATGVTPASGSGASQSFVFTFADSAGWQDLGVVDVLFNNFLDGIQGCYIAYSVPAATLYLVDDGGDAGGPFAGYLALPGTGSMSNSQCTVNGTGSSAAGSGNTLTLTLNVSFTGAFAGNRIFYTAAGNAAGTENSGWNALGAWTVP